MAKVYSWAINNRTYAYIVSPTNTNEAYVGTELKGNNLKIVSDWAQNATDTQYDTQFAKMVALCTSKGYNVSFESALSYRTVETTCDNLRGPAGRGIQSVKFDRTDETLSWYKMIYDDGTEDEFFVKNGTNGKDGADGKDGAQGDTGISSKLIMVYTSGRNANGELITPDRPEGGSFNFNTFETTYPDGWAPSDKALTPPVWMSSRTFTSSALSTDKEWSYPTQITGENGSPGADGTNTEFIFKLTSIKPTESEVSELYSDPDKSGVVPNSNWKASPEGVDEENKTEYYCIRRRNLTTGKWGKWEGAYIWSKYGVNGQDGDGVQYIFMRTKKGTPPINPTPMGYDDPQSEIYANYQNKDTEWVPASGTSYYNYNNELVKLTDDEYWSDNVQGVDATYQWEWVSVRKYRKNSSNNQHEWKAFDTPALWAKFGEDGKHATSIRRLYCLTSGTNDVPEAPSDNVITGDWGNGFPKGYRKDENVVWAIEAEIWAHNNEFVFSYMVVSATDENGNILPPNDATTTNTKTVESIPAEKYADENIKYLIFNNEYYEWKGGWCEPFLVTGVKGDSGEPVNYTTRYFCAGYNNVLPLIPDTQDKNDFEDRYKYQDVEGNTVYWYRSPDTSRGGVDGSIDDTGKERRWYECLVYINGWDNKIIEYGEIGPLNPRDGEIKDGRYCEFRFGITDLATVTPYVEQTTPEGLPIRNPKMKPEEGSGWYSSEDDIPAVPVNGALWVIWAYIESDGTMKKDSNGKVWYGPTKISGARGPEGPIGPRGFTGVPGVSMIQRFCLGTYGSKDNNTTGESYFYNGSGYFGSTNWSGTTEDKIVPVGELEGWYTAQSAPYTNIIECSTEDELNTIIANPKNRGRVVKHTYQKSGTTYYDYILIRDTFLGGSEVGYPATANILSGKTKEEVEKLIEDENWGIYLWCIQGSEVWETDEKTGTSKLLGVEWGNPFKMQGSNGIRGIAGNRGQTIYPMGVYNHEEVYITDTNKAPYVYDPNDGLYYIYNVVDTPWVGQLPTGYQNIMKHPSDIYVKGNANFKTVATDPTNNTSQDTSVKYLCYNNNYYVWQSGKYVMVSRYKYSIDGTNGNWIPAQNGVTPSENYANQTNINEAPAWVRMESFDAIYTNVGIIANGMIGSAVYNNEFMFSQQGVNQNGDKTNYADVLNKDDEGFLSAYHYSEAANNKGWHWRDENGNYMDVSEINPYKKGTNGKYIHKFMPNVCINFATGQMWLQCGKLQFGATSSNVYTSGEVDTQIDEKVSAAEAQVKNAQDELDKMSKKLDDWDNDGLLNPTELKELAKEYETIVAEFESICKQSENAGLDTSPGNKPHYNYTQVYHTVTAMTQNYYLKTEDGKYVNATATTDTATGKFIKGGDCVIIKQGTDNQMVQYDYRYYQKYYEHRQKLLQAISDKLNEKIDSIEVVDNSWLTNQFSSGTTDFYGGAVLSNLLAVKDENQYVTGYINGNNGTDFVGRNENSYIMLGLGMDTEVDSAVTLYQWYVPSDWEKYGGIYNSGTTTNSLSEIGEWDVAVVSDEDYSDIEFIYLNADSAYSIPTLIENGTLLCFTENSAGKLEKLNWRYFSPGYYNRNEPCLWAGYDDTLVKPYRCDIDVIKSISKTQTARTKIYNDGLIETTQLDATKGFFGGEIDCNGIFHGKIDVNEGDMKNVEIMDCNISDSNFIVNKDSRLQICEGDTYTGYYGYPVFTMDNLEIETGSTTNSISVDSAYHYHKNSNGNNNGQWYGNDNFITLTSININNEAITASTPSILCDYWIYTSGNKTAKTPYVGMYFSGLKNGTWEVIETLHPFGEAAFLSGDTKGGDAYWRVVVPKKTAIKVSSGYTAVGIQYVWSMHLHTYAWLGADKSAGSLTIKPLTDINTPISEAKITVNYPARPNTFHLGKNGISFYNKDNKTNVIISPKKIEMSREGVGIKIENGQIYLSTAGTSDLSYKKLIISGSTIVVSS